MRAQVKSSPMILSKSFAATNVAVVSIVQCETRCQQNRPSSENVQSPFKFATGTSGRLCSHLFHVISLHFWLQLPLIPLLQSS